MIVPLSNAWLPSMWLTVAWILVHDFKTPSKKIVDCKVFQFIHTMKIKKMLDHKTLRCKYTTTSSRERDELGQELCLLSQFAWTEFAECLCNLCTVWRLLKQSFQIGDLKSCTGIHITVSHVLGNRVSERETVTTEQVRLGIGVRVQL